MSKDYWKQEMLWSLVVFSTSRCRCNVKKEESVSQDIQSWGNSDIAQNALSFSLFNSLTCSGSFMRNLVFLVQWTELVDIVETDSNVSMESSLLVVSSSILSSIVFFFGDRRTEGGFSEGNLPLRLSWLLFLVCFIDWDYWLLHWWKKLTLEGTPCIWHITYYQLFDSSKVDFQKTQWRRLDFNWKSQKDQCILEKIQPGHYAQILEH